MKRKVQNHMLRTPSLLNPDRCRKKRHNVPLRGNLHVSIAFFSKNDGYRAVFKFYFLSPLITLSSSTASLFIDEWQFFFAAI